MKKSVHASRASCFDIAQQNARSSMLSMQFPFASPEMATRLDKAFGGGAETWLRLQAAYDLAQAEKGADKIKVRRIA